MPTGADRAVTAWRRLAGSDAAGRVRVVVDPSSWLAPTGWIGIVAIAETITASVPRPELEAPVKAVLDHLDATAAVQPEVVGPLLPPFGSSLGPVALFHPPEDFTPPPSIFDTPSADELRRFLQSVAPDDLNESGIDRLDSPGFASRTEGGDVAAVCGYRRWPNGVAHLAVVTLPGHRSKGHGRKAASAAIAHGLANGLLPQWRARPLASQRLAWSLGLEQMGAQLSLQPM